VPRLKDFVPPAAVEYFAAPYRAYDAAGGRGE